MLVARLEKEVLAVRFAQGGLLPTILVARLEKEVLAVNSTRINLGFQEVGTRT